MKSWSPLILIIEDDADLAQLNARVLKRQKYNVIIAHTVNAAKLVVSANRPDLIVLDIGLPDGDGLSLCREIRKDTDTPVIFLTGKTETKDIIAGLNTGGDYYLTKPYNKDEFLAVVQRLLYKSEQMRTTIAEASVIRRGTLTLRLDERKAYVNKRDAELSLKEFNVLLILVQNEEKEVTYEQIYENVWGSTMQGDSSALRQQISRIKKKLDEENAVDFAIFNDHGRGYTFTTIV